MTERIKMVRPQWERYVHKNGQFAFEFDPRRGVIRCVNRGGTIEYDLAARMAEVQNGEVDSAATPHQ